MLFKTMSGPVPSFWTTPFQWSSCGEVTHLHFKEKMMSTSSLPLHLFVSVKRYFTPTSHQHRPTTVLAQELLFVSFPVGALVHPCPLCLCRGESGRKRLPTTTCAAAHHPGQRQPDEHHLHTVQGNQHVHDLFDLWPENVGNLELLETSKNLSNDVNKWEQTLRNLERTVDGSKTGAAFTVHRVCRHLFKLKEWLWGHKGSADRSWAIQIKQTYTYTYMFVYKCEQINQQTFECTCPQTPVHTLRWHRF